MKKKQEPSFAYTPKYDEARSNYQKIFTNDGVDFEIQSFYMTDRHTISNPPDHKEVVNKLIYVLRGTGISKITITFLDKNLNSQKQYCATKKGGENYELFR